MAKIAALIIISMMLVFTIMENVSAGGLDPCSQPKDAGSCRARIPKFFYNTATKSCEQFDWGGCEGNLNQFPDKEECEKACGH